MFHGDFWAFVGMVVAAIITSIISPFVTRRLLRPTVQKVSESHHALTVNHHSSSERTVIDRLTDIENVGIKNDHQFNQGTVRMNRIEDFLGMPRFKGEPWVHPEDN